MSRRNSSSTEKPHQLVRSGYQLRDAKGRDVIKLAMENKFSVSKVAAAVGMRVPQLKAALEHTVGLGTKEFFRHHRAVQARWMIAEGCPLKDISRLLSFRYYTHFAAEIRSFYGIPPRDLKKIIMRQISSTGRFSGTLAPAPAL